MSKLRLKKSRKRHDYVPARLVEGASRWYIEFSVWHVQKEELIRKRVSVGKVRDKAAKRKESRLKVAQINTLLMDGWVIDEGELETEQKEEIKFVGLLDGLRQAVAIKEAGNGEFSASNYRSCLNVFTEWAKEEELHLLDIRSVERKKLYEFIDYLQQEREVGNRTVVNYILRLNALFNLLVEREVIEENPMKGMKRPKAASETHTVYTPQQQALLEAWLKENNYRLYLFTRLIYYAFLRPVEISRLKVEHIRMAQRTIVMPAEAVKSRRQQSIYMIDPLYELLLEENLDRLRGTDYLFSKGLEPGRIQWHRKNATALHREALEETGLYDGKLTMYSWKHTGVCNAYLAGVDIKTLQSLLRHSGLDMTAIYMRALGLQVDENLKGKSW